MSEMKKSENSTIFQNDRYCVKITIDETYTIDSADNKRYDYVLNPSSKRRRDMYKVLHLLVKGVQSADIALIGDYYTYPEDCAILEDSILTVLQNDYITQIDLKTVQIIACYELDVFGTTFSIYRMADGYLIYGEIEIIKFDNNFNPVWKFSGRDIFVSISDKNAFELTEQSIKLYDFDDNFYELDFDGNIICEVLKG